MTRTWVLQVLVRAQGTPRADMKQFWDFAGTEIIWRVSAKDCCYTKLMGTACLVGLSFGKALLEKSQTLTK